jgi:malate dehydrogenase (oxaloacetate-decarboxylating)(NADP+)
MEYLAKNGFFRGNILKASKNWLERNIQVIVVTDGECILGLGDLGCQVLMLINLFTNWMCIPLLIS